MALLERYDPKRVVVTGVGMVSNLGSDSASSYTNLLNGETGLSPLSFGHPNVHIAGEIHTFSADEVPFIERKQTKYYSYAGLLAEKATQEALAEAGLLVEQGIHEDIRRERFGVYIGTGVGGAFDEDEGQPKTGWKARESGATAIFKVLPDQVGSPIARRLDLMGPTVTHVAACNSGTESLIGATMQIATGQADIMIAGATEAAISPRIITYFDNITALSRNKNVNHPSTPFDIDRSGFHMADGAGILILEEYEHAMERGATPLAEIMGFGSSADGNTTPVLPTGKGIERAMRLATRDMQPLNAENVLFISAHATATPKGDIAEAEAIRNVFPDRDNVFIHAAKGNRGHSCGAAGALAAAEMVRSLQYGVLPPNKYNQLMESMDYHMPKEAYNLPVRYALVNSSGFGGVNGSFAMKVFEE